MLLKKTELKNRSELSQIREIYLEAFPSDERAPFQMLVKRAKKGKAEMFSLIHEGELCGMTYIVRYRDMAYVFYLAVSKEKRGMGLGTKAMKAILERYKDSRVFIALEDWREDAANKEQRCKRHSFYLNCGLCDLPYHIKEAEVIYAIMGSDGPIEPEEYKALMNNYMGFFMRHIVDMRIIKPKTGKK